MALFLVSQLIYGEPTMQQIKIFKNVENDLAALEEEVNTWIVESEAAVLQVFGNISPQSRSSLPHATGLTKSEFPPSDVMIVVLYDRVR
jgi:hypothetical protein